MLIIFIILFLFPGIGSAETLAELVSPDEDFSKLFPFTQKVTGTAFTCNKNVSGPMELLIVNNSETGNIEMKVISTITTAYVIINNHLGPVFSETRFPQSIPEIIKKAGHDWRIYAMDTKKEKKDDLILSLFSNEKRKTIQTFTMDRNTYPSDTLMLICQALLFKGIKEDFIFNFISLDDVLKVKASMTYHFTREPLSLAQDFPFPEGMEKAIIPGKLYHVYEIKLRGFLRLIIRAHWCLVYDAEYPYNFVAYWGGEGNNAETMCMTGHETISVKK